MFTGLIESTGTVLSVIRTAGSTRITVVGGALISRLNLGDSVAVNGTCLTALAIEPQGEPPRFSADLAAETVARTTLSRLRAGSLVNLELPTPAGSPLGGHVVQGHVDGTATLLALEAIHPGHLHSTDWRLALSLPEDLARNVVQQGSITVEGISLTVALFRPTPTGAEVEIAVIPHTYKSTNLHSLAPGDPLNIETDVLARYSAQQARVPPKAEWLTTAYLLSRGY